jgi:L-2-hydroxycarboxylate dehydrogenase (NAD+)
VAEVQHIPVDIDSGFVEEVFRGLGVPPADARICAGVLIASDLRGIESHGVGRLKYYYDRIRAGVQFPQTLMEIVKETETTALVEAHHGMGHVVAYRSMRMAMEKAGQFGLGGVAVRNGTHFGIAGYYSLMAAAEGMIGLTVTNARPAVAPTFGAEPMLGTNPIAFAAPSDLPYPFCFDAATSITQRGKIEVLARAEEPVPEGWVVDAQGNSLTSPHEALEGLSEATAALLPLGGAGESLAGYKGYSLAALVEILSAGLSGGPFMKDLLGFAEDGSRRPYMLGHFFLAIDVEHFVPLDTFRGIVGGIMRGLQSARRLPGEERIYVAGEKEYEMERQVRQRGVPVNPNLMQELRIMREALGISGYEGWF